MNAGATINQSTGTRPYLYERHPAGMATNGKSQWGRQACGCVKAELPSRGRVVIRCRQHDGKPTKKGKREVLYRDEDGIIRTEAYVKQRPEPPIPNRVYFARLGNRIKIGISYDPEERAKSLNAELLGHIEGDRDLEAKLHREFNDLRTRGEWFKAKMPLLERIEALLA